jgi:hypothetical protein
LCFASLGFNVCYALSDVTWHFYIIFVNCDFGTEFIRRAGWYILYLFIVFGLCYIFSFVCMAMYVLAGRPVSVFWGEQVSFQVASRLVLSDLFCSIFVPLNIGLAVTFILVVDCISVRCAQFTFCTFIIAVYICHRQVFQEFRSYVYVLHGFCLPRCILPSTMSFRSGICNTATTGYVVMLRRCRYVPSIV